VLAKTHTVDNTITEYEECLQCTLIYVILTMNTNEVLFMLLNKQQLALSLSELTHHDYELLNNIIIEYVQMIDDNKFDDLEQYVNNHIHELM
jgi:hypothetical protein